MRKLTMTRTASVAFHQGRTRHRFSILAWLVLGVDAVLQKQRRNVATILRSNGEVDVENFSSRSLLNNGHYARKDRGAENRDMKEICTVTEEGPYMGIGGLTLFTFNDLVHKAANEDCSELRVEWKNCLYCGDGHNPFSQLFLHPIPITEETRAKARAARMETPLCERHIMELSFGCHAEFDLETQAFTKPWSFKLPLQPHHDVISAAFNALIQPLPNLWQAVPILKQPVIAVQVRAAAYSDLGPFEMVPIKSYVKALHDLYDGPAKNVTTTFLMTDSADAVPIFKKHAREPLVTNQKSWRGTGGPASTNDPIVHLQYQTVAARLADARQVLIEVLTASQADMFLHHESALAKLAFLFARKQRSFFIANPSERKTMLSLSEASTEEEQSWLRNCAWQNKHVVFEDTMESCTGELYRGWHGFCVPVQNEWDGQLGRCCRAGSGNDGYKQHCMQTSLRQMSMYINVSTE